MSTLCWVAKKSWHRVLAGLRQPRTSNFAVTTTSVGPALTGARFDSAFFKIFLREFRLPFPLSVGNCRCNLQLDALEHYCAVCATAKVLGGCWGQLQPECVGSHKRFCSRHGFGTRRQRSRLLEMVADGLPFYGHHNGVIFADGRKCQARCSHQDGEASAQARKRKERA